MNKICVYTCITGSYDTLKPIDFKDKDYDYICFTNNKNIKSDSWKVIYINEDLDNLTLARKTKILGHKELDKYDTTIWMDGAIKLREPFSKFIKEKCDLNKYDFIGFKHRFRDCIYDEMDAVVFTRKDSLENVKKLKSLYVKEKYPEHNGLIESTVLVRKNTKDVKKLMEVWFDILSNYSRRDQLSFNYALWKNPIKYKELDMNVFDNEYFYHSGHSGVLFSKRYRIYYNGSHNIDNLYEGEYTYDEKNYNAKITVPYDTESIEFIISPFDYVIVNSIECSNEYEVDLALLHECKVAYDNIKLSFNGDFKKGDKINISLDLEPISKDVFMDIAKRSSDYYLGKSNEYLNEITAIKNSRSWKLMEKMRKIKR